MNHNVLAMKQLFLIKQQSKPYKLSKFIDEMQQLKDCRDNRGKRHKLAFVVCSVTLAILSGRAKLSSIQRYMANRIDWLRKITVESEAQVVSRAQLPRILSRLDRPAVNMITSKHFGIRLIETSEGDWKAIDGKTLRGTLDEQGNQRTRIVTAVNHASRENEAQCEFDSTKKGEITAVRTFLQETGLEKANITLDALHLNPTTTSQIEQAGGHYIIQAKQNQPELCETLTTVANTAIPTAILNSAEQGQGRQEERWAWFFDLANVPLDGRWQQSNLQTLIVILPQTTESSRSSSSPKISLALSYYLSNYSLTTEAHIQPLSLFQAVRRHWGVESNNWIRDVTFQEDLVHTNDPHLAQLLASLRTFAIRLLRQAAIPNFQAALERFTDCPKHFSDFLHDARVL